MRQARLASATETSRCTTPKPPKSVPSSPVDASVAVITGLQVRRVSVEANTISEHIMRSSALTGFQCFHLDSPASSMKR
eukprot:9394213-Pyramimonas_sp.AAC.1